MWVVIVYTGTKTVVVGPFKLRREATAFAKEEKINNPKSRFVVTRLWGA